MFCPHKHRTIRITSPCRTRACARACVCVISWVVGLTHHFSSVSSVCLLLCPPPLSLSFLCLLAHNLPWRLCVSQTPTAQSDHFSPLFVFGGLTAVASADHSVCLLTSCIYSYIESFNCNFLQLNTVFDFIDCAAALLHKI